MFILYNHLNVTETHNDYEIFCKERIIESMETFLDDNDLILKIR